jgi:hypothetical protein
MKRITSLFVILLLFSPVSLLAHKPLLMVDDNLDGTIYIETGFSDGGSGAGHTIRLLDAATKAVLIETKVPDIGSLDLQKPSVPYIVLFDAGEGHTVEMDGPPPTEVGNQAVTVDKAPTEPSPQPTPTGEPAETVRTEPSSFAVGPGFSSAYRMMVGTQVFISVGIFLIFGILMFLIGRRWEKNRHQRSSMPI